MMDEFEHKYQIFLTYWKQWGEEETKRRLGLKDWEYEHFAKRKRTIEYGYRVFGEVG